MKRMDSCVYEFDEEEKDKDTPTLTSSAVEKPKQSTKHFRVMHAKCLLDVIYIL